MKPIVISTIVEAGIRKVWDLWTTPVHIMKWNFATDGWHCPSAVNDLRPEGKFSWRMEARDGSMGFDYSGVYERIDETRLIEKKLDDGRRVWITFSELDGKTEVTESFEPDANDPDLQKQGWQAILDNFKNYVESAP